MSLNVIDPFHQSCTTQLSTSTTPTVITSLYEAAKIIARRGVNKDIADHIANELDNGAEFKNWIAPMPPQTPKALSDYQSLFKGFNSHNSQDVKDAFDTNSEILRHGSILPHGQILFHGGHWKCVTSNLTIRPLSTTFCPEVAMREAEHRGKSDAAGYIDLLYITLEKPQTRAFIFKHDDPEMGHEKEVLFATGAKVTVTKRTCITDAYPASHGKTIRCYLVEAKLT